MSLKTKYIILLVLVIGVIAYFFINRNHGNWSKAFIKVNITSSIDNSIQKAYFYKSTATKPTPLIVSLHTWNGRYFQQDSIAKLCTQKNINYIHPDFRGQNNHKNACNSNLALQDIDDAITYAIENANVDASNIFVVGVSGGGFATLSTFMKSKHAIKKYAAWASMTDLTAWYSENDSLTTPYPNNILKCTDSKNGVLNIENAKAKSPIYWETPISKLENTKLSIYAGINDDVVSITHSINFYNKLLKDLEVTDASQYVSEIETQQLLNKNAPKVFNSTMQRDVYLVKAYNNIKLVVFEGNHEMLTEYAFNELLKN